MSEIMHDPDVYEPVDRNKLAAELRERGFKDQDVMDMLIRWTEQQEAIADTSGLYGRIQFEIDRARLYLDAGLTDEAKTAFRDAYDLAYQLGQDVKAAEILAEIKRLGFQN